MELRMYNALGVGATVMMYRQQDRKQQKWRYGRRSREEDFSHHTAVAAAEAVGVVGRRYLLVISIPSHSKILVPNLKK